MTSREIIKAVLTFAHPPRIGMTLPDPYPHDMLLAGQPATLQSPRPVPPQGNELRRWVDAWGVTWASLTEFDKGEVVAGALDDWSQLDNYRPPDLGVKEAYKDAQAKFAADNGQKFRVGSIPGFTFNVARKLRKLEDYLCDLLLNRDQVDRLHEIIRNELLKAIDCWAKVGADAIIFCEDWGTQNRLMISPAMWREIFKPEFKTLAGRAHEHGMSVLMHSCGKMTDIIEDLIECGINCLQFDQPRLHGIENLADRFAGRVTFWCPVDVQDTLQTRDPERIRSDAQLMIEKLGGNGGGFIAGYYASNESIGLRPEIQDIACKAFVEYGNYEK